ncbi:MAG: PTS sugar transporter subunit IIA [Candidatus Aminicenantes bacterium]|nr:PTS sugar transporter subunit IIA [Candidatus Aminicenantes bacterium]
MKLAKYLKSENIYLTETCKDTDSFYGDFSKFLKDRGLIEDVKKIKRLFVKRESIQSTGIGKGVATPHIFSSEFSAFLLAAAFIHHGLDFKAPDKRDVQLVFLIMSDDRDIGLHLKTLAHIARLTAGSDIIGGLQNARSAAEIYAILIEKEKTILN